LSQFHPVQGISEKQSPHELRQLGNFPSATIAPPSRNIKGFGETATTLVTIVPISHNIKDHNETKITIAIKNIDCHHLTISRITMKQKSQLQ